MITFKAIARCYTLWGSGFYRCYRVHYYQGGFYHSCFALASPLGTVLGEHTTSA